MEIVNRISKVSTIQDSKFFVLLVNLFILHGSCVFEEQNIAQANNAFLVHICYL